MAFRAPSHLIPMESSSLERHTQARPPEHGCTSAPIPQFPGKKSTKRLTRCRLRPCSFLECTVHRSVADMVCIVAPVLNADCQDNLQDLRVRVSASMQKI